MPDKWNQMLMVQVLLLLPCYYSKTYQNRLKRLMLNYAEISNTELQWENQVVCQAACRELGSIWGICQIIYFHRTIHAPNFFRISNVSYIERMLPHKFSFTENTFKMVKTIYKFRLNVVNNFGLTKNCMLKGMP